MIYNVVMKMMLYQPNHMATIVARIKQREGLGSKGRTIACKYTRGYQQGPRVSRNLFFNGLKQREIELEEGSARASWYETELLIGQPNGGSPKLFFSQIIC